MTKKERKKRFNFLSEYGCVICRQPAEIHHLIGIEHKGLGQKAPDDKTIPLCPNHHRGQQGIHTLGKRVWESKFGKQEILLAKVNKMLGLTQEY